MHIGLIGGIGPAATDFYYRRLIANFADRRKPLDLTIVHADAPTLLHHLERNDSESQVEIYRRLTDRLQSAGAECVVVTSIAGHFCIDTFKEHSPLPIIDMLAEVDKTISAKQLRRIGILGTRTVMESRFYNGVTAAEIIPPSGRDLGDVHEAYIEMAMSGQVNGAQRAVFDDASKRLLQQENVEAIMLGGTDLALVYNEAHDDFPIVDCAAIHVDAVVRLAAG